jgi:Zn-dependent protease
MTTVPLQQILQQLSVWLLPGLFAITVHEAAHGIVAALRGDKTAFFLGRTSLNPLKHIDPIGTIAVPLTLLLLQSSFLFGWAKPVPVNYRNLKKPKLDMALVAIAGPAANMIMAILWLLILKIALHFAPTHNTPQLSWLIQTSHIGVLFNIVLAVFNMLPIPPMDGSRIISAVLPHRACDAYNALEPYGMLIIMGLIFSGILGRIIYPGVAFFLSLARMIL